MLRACVGPGVPLAETSSPAVNQRYKSVLIYMVPPRPVQYTASAGNAVRNLPAHARLLWANSLTQDRTRQALGDRSPHPPWTPSQRPAHRSKHPASPPLAAALASPPAGSRFGSIIHSIFGPIPLVPRRCLGLDPFWEWLPGCSWTIGSGLRKKTPASSMPRPQLPPSFVRWLPCHFASSALQAASRPVVGFCMRSQKEPAQKCPG
jgi:hypothetical protein